jgi:hypothetical protein
MPYKGPFQSFRKLYNLQDTWPAPLYDLLFYIAYMSHTGLSASTITTYISGISTMHKLNGHTDNTKSFLVTKILEGSKRKNSPKADLRLPVSMNLLKRLIQSLPFVCTSVYESTMFASAFSFCFFGLLRVGEILVPDCICLPVVSVSVLTLFIRYIYYWSIQLLHNEASYISGMLVAFILSKYLILVFIHFFMNLGNHGNNWILVR